MRLALLQINPTAGDLEGNSTLIGRAARLAQAQGADLMVTPELALMGYLPRDLLMNRGFIRRAGEKLEHIAGELKDASPKPPPQPEALENAGAGHSRDCVTGTASVPG